MNKNSKIYVAGHRGLVGSAIVKNLISKGYTNIITRTHSELDLTNQKAVEEFFTHEKPEYVILASLCTSSKIIKTLSLISETLLFWHFNPALICSFVTSMPQYLAKICCTPLL